MRTRGMHRNRPILLAAVLAAGALLGACGGDDASDADSAQPAPAAAAEPGAAAVEAATVTAERSRFAPRDVTVAAGGEVTFRNLDAAAHTVTSAEGAALAFDSGDLAEGDEFVQRFDEPGSYPYLCVIHPTMKGTVVVE